MVRSRLREPLDRGVKSISAAFEGLEVVKLGDDSRGLILIQDLVG
jgi:hypothetical protein